MRPRQVAATVASVDPAGAYQLLTLRGSAVGSEFVPGQFAAVAVGGEQTSMLLRRCFSIHRAMNDTLQIVVAARGPGTRWLARRRPGDVLDVIAPLGHGFPLPAATEVSPADAACVLVGGGYGSAPLFTLAALLRSRGHATHLVLGAAAADRLFGVDKAAPVADSVTVTTDDGSTGVRGWVSDVLPALLTVTGSRLVYACGPMAMLRAVSRIASDHAAVAYTAVEEAMACGIGICMTCVLPVVGDDGRTRMTRSCTDGPVFDGSRVRWDDVGSIPADCLGATTAGAH